MTLSLVFQYQQHCLKWLNKKIFKKRGIYMQEQKREFISKDDSQGVFSDSKNDIRLLNTCLTCGQEFTSFKECIQCCADID